MNKTIFVDQKSEIPPFNACFQPNQYLFTTCIHKQMVVFTKITFLMLYMYKGFVCTNINHQIFFDKESYFFIILFKLQSDVFQIVSIVDKQILKTWQTLFLFYLYSVHPLFKQSHVCIIQSLVGKIDDLYIVEELCIYWQGRVN